MNAILLLWIAIATLGLFTAWNTFLSVGVLARVLAGSQAQPSVSLGQRFGQPAPQFELSDHRGMPVTSDDLYEGKLGLLFITPYCPLCSEALGHLSYIRSKVTRLVIVCNSTTKDCTDLYNEHGAEQTVLFDETQAVRALFGILQSPTMVIIEGGEIISYGKPYVESSGDFTTLVSSEATL